MVSCFNLWLYFKCYCQFVKIQVRICKDQGVNSQHQNVENILAGLFAVFRYSCICFESSHFSNWGWEEGSQGLKGHSSSCCYGNHGGNDSWWPLTSDDQPVTLTSDDSVLWFVSSPQILWYRQLSSKENLHGFHLTKVQIAVWWSYFNVHYRLSR